MPIIEQPWEWDKHLLPHEGKRDNFNFKFNIFQTGLTMERVSILEFRRDADAVIRKVRQGKRLILTYRGKPVMRLEPIQDHKIDPNDPFYAIAQLAIPNGRSFTNEEIDQIVYES